MIISSKTKPKVFSTIRSTLYTDIDMYGHVYAGKYTEILTNHRVEAIRNELKLEFQDFSQMGVLFYLKNLNIDFIRPIVLKDEILISSYISEVGEKDCLVSFKAENSINKKLLFTATFNYTCICSKTIKPIVWPVEVIELFFEKANDE
jgi:acyl-CoA thioester hydrolase